MKKKLFLFCCFFISFNLYSQSVYTLDLKKDIVISTLSLGMFIPPLFINDHQDIPTNLDKNDVIAFDRWLMFPFNKGFQTARIPLMIVYNSSIIIPPLLISLGNQAVNFDVWLTYGVMFTQAFLFTYGTKEMIGRLVNRDRPYLYFDEAYNFSITDGRHNRSFPSGGTAVSFMPATFLSVTFAHEFPESRWKIPVIVGSFTLSSFVGATRILAGDHFLSDVLIGAAIGSLYGWLIPTLHKINNDENGVSFNFTGNGIIMAIKY
jgi:membrane-associated phospholipid phosphatase